MNLLYLDTMKDEIAAAKSIAAQAQALAWRTKAFARSLAAGTAPSGFEAREAGADAAAIARQLADLSAATNTMLAQYSNSLAGR